MIVLGKRFITHIQRDVFCPD